MARRKTISTRTRFEVFKRDHFTCQYCGSKPPAVILHIDHITPISKGGTNNLDNLITSCQDCNLGKSDVPLNATRPTPTTSTILELREAREQLEAYQAYLMEERTTREANATVVAELLYRQVSYKASSTNLVELSGMLKDLPLAEALDAVDITTRRGLAHAAAWRYFCGVAWTKIKAAREGISTFEALERRQNRRVN